MRFSTTSALATGFSLLSTTTAIITGITAPATVTAGKPFTLTITTADYIQSVYDVGVGFGIAPGTGFPGSLGDVFSSAYLGPTLSNTLNKIPFTVTVPLSTAKGPAIISAGVLSLFGVGADPVVNTFNTTVSVVTA